MKKLIKVALEYIIADLEEDYAEACKIWNATGDNTGIYDLEGELKEYKQALADLDSTTVISTEQLGHAIAEYFDLPLTRNWTPVFYRTNTGIHSAQGLVAEITPGGVHDCRSLPPRSQPQPLLADG